MRDVSKAYRSGRGRIQALEGIDCIAEAGAAVAVVGRSGSGKTTLLNCLGGLERPDRGTIRCGDVNLHTLTRRGLSLFQRRSLGFVFQFGNLLSYLTVHENIAFPMALNGFSRPTREKRVGTLLERIGLQGAGPALPRELSGGEIQRVSFARAVAHGPQLLLADEPTASLDSCTGRGVVGLMLDLVRDQGCTLVVTTHDPVVMEFADRVVRLHDGRVVADPPAAARDLLPGGRAEISDGWAQG